MPVNPLYSDEWNEKLPPICRNCGYNLTGLHSGRCPECGTRYLMSDLRSDARRMYFTLKQIEDMNEFVGFGYYLAGAAFGFLLLFRVIGLAPLGRMIAILLGLSAIGAGLQVLRARRLPAWTTEFQRIEPNFQGGCWVAAAGIVGIAGAMLMP